jgi:hypothetical protein
MGDGLMRIARVGGATTEKPAILYDDGAMRDVSIFLTEIDCGFVSVDWRRALADLAPESMPLVDSKTRCGSCIASHRRILATEPVGTAGGGMLSLAPTDGRAVGAHDPIPLPHSGRFAVRAGVAAAVRVRSGSPPEIGGLFLYAHVSPVAQNQPDTLGLVASGEGLLSFGPWLVDAGDWPASQPLQVEVSVNGAPSLERRSGMLVEEVTTGIAIADGTVPLTSGDVLLFGARDAPEAATSAIPTLPGDVVVVSGGALGSQERLCVRQAARRGN